MSLQGGGNSAVQLALHLRHKTVSDHVGTRKRFDQTGQGSQMFSGMPQWVSCSETMLYSESLMLFSSVLADRFIG